ncbi:hypothetical protein HNY73_010014 [Argiope bruennichi]|uniref:Uncharacterized protein n=1 Tax=Argiope bruennichi TaxID=94029 RepID=A0A8T0F4I3_ARGBR|nr:hypothetical protein HNY73_010014 [Argiope bruennichi]
MSPPKRKRIRKIICSANLDDFDFCKLRQTVSEFNARNEVPSLRTQLCLYGKGQFFWKVEILRYVLRKIGFRWKQTSVDKKIVRENTDILQ